MSDSSYITWHIRRRLSCLMCGRQAATAEGAVGQRAKAVPTDPDHESAVKRLCCPFCSGRLWWGEPEPVRVFRRIPAGVDVVKRGRPARTVDPQKHMTHQAKYYARKTAGLVASARWARDYDACVKCNKTDSLHNAHGLCNRCKQSKRRAGRAV